MWNKYKTHCKNGHEFTNDNTEIVSSGSRRCRTCHRLNEQQRYHTNYNYRMKTLERAKQAFRKDPEKHYIAARKYNKANKKKKQDYHYLYKYGLTPEAYQELLKKQDYHCAMCDSKEHLEVDHNHKTEKVREILCHKHNMVLAMADDNIDILYKAISYLEKHSSGR